jgi:lipoprotein-releasing system ATP-binding protein
LILEARHISKTFKEHSGFDVLKDINLKVDNGEFVCVTGKSGCGKSTLLYVLSTMDTNYQGELLVDEELLTGKKSDRLAEVRNEKIGFVFQFHYLLNEFTVLRNVMLPGLKLNRFSKEQVEEKAKRWLDKLEIGKLADHKPNRLSGGEKQRVAIARALINDPHIIMADEPTGNLDKKNGGIVFDIFKTLCDDYRQTLFIVTHDPEFAARSKRIIRMEDGGISER